MRPAAPFLGATLLGAFLLFLVQPLVARAILPATGGTPAVWTTCMLFFQLLLVGGYGYVHLIVTRFPLRRQVRVHGLVIGLSLLVLGLGTVSSGAPLIHAASYAPDWTRWPQLHILRLLFLGVGVPYLVVATTGPLLASWFQRVGAGSPYRLYALSNAGSLAGLLGYPLVVEVTLSLRAQAFFWSGLYLVLCAATLTAGLRALAAPGSAAPSPAPRSAAQVEAVGSAQGGPVVWAGLTFTASTLLLATTNQLCQDLAAVPLLWVLPLSLYLVSYILCFAEGRWYLRGLFIPVFAAASVVALSLMPNPSVALHWQIAAWCALLFSGCMICHGEYARARPDPRQLSRYYLAGSVGGALGGVLVALVAPLVFNAFYEVQLGIAACVLVCARALYPVRGDVSKREGRIGLRRLAIGLASIAAFVGLGMSTLEQGGSTLLAARSFFGILRVIEKPSAGPRQARYLAHGRIVHGMQLTGDQWRGKATGYYGAESGLGRSIVGHPRGAEGLRIGMCGLGVGTVAAYVRAQDQLRVYEIDPAVVALSMGPTPAFRYLAEASGKVDVVLGDARVSLESELRHGKPGAYDVLAIDAFGGDAIPVHLLTREAVQLYLSHLRGPDGVVALHLSNTHLDLVPVVRAVAESLALPYVVVRGEPPEELSWAAWESTWVVLARSEATLARLREFGSKETIRDLRPWTDDYSNILQVLR